MKRFFVVFLVLGLLVGRSTPPRKKTKPSP